MEGGGGGEHICAYRDAQPACINTIRGLSLLVPFANIVWGGETEFSLDFQTSINLWQAESSSVICFDRIKLYHK